MTAGVQMDPPQAQVGRLGDPVDGPVHQVGSEAELRVGSRGQHLPVGHQVHGFVQPDHDIHDPACPAGRRRQPVYLPQAVDHRHRYHTVGRQLDLRVGLEVAVQERIGG